ncbi:MAG: L-threonylcarbamoyladenylate synthase [Fimbriimonas sp.]
MRDAIEQAAEILRRGGLVGMPTETVYGIAAIASNREAVRRTFAVKGRPVENPLIVHLADVDQVPLVSREFPDSARLLADAFWPGPLTLVLWKQLSVLAEVTGGLDTVAVRIPNHPVALGLIRAAGEPLSAPSANSFMHLSPTQADHIEPELASKLDCVLDGGPCEVGLESTVVDCTGEPRILRPGGISREAIEAVLGHPLGSSESSERRAPGQYPRHYAPKTPLRLVDELTPGTAGLTFFAEAGPYQLRMPDSPVAYGVRLYAALHELDQGGFPEIQVETPPNTPEWEAVWDRLKKAASS